MKARMFRLTGRLRAAVVAPLLALLFIGFGSLLAPQRVSAQAADPCHATPNNGTTVFSSLNAHAVQQAVDAASAGGTVKVAGTCVGVESRASTNQSTYISKTLTLSGGYTTTNWTTSHPITQPSTIDANSGGRVIFATTALTVSNITLQRGAISGSGFTCPEAGCGGGVWAQGALTLSNVHVLSNTARYTGGGAAAEDAVTAANSRFENNRSTDSAGGGLTALSTLWLTNTHFLSNTASIVGGGALAIGAVTAVNSRFENNRTDGQGGGLYAESTLWLTNTHFISNTASSDGGGAYAFDAVTAANSRFENNRSTDSNGGGLYTNSTLLLTNTHFISNTASFGGGGAAVLDAVTAVNSRFENNRSTGSRGGGLYAGSTLLLTNTHFISNTASSIGGGVYAFGAVTAANSRFENNRSTGNEGGGLYAYSTLWLTNTHFLSNTASSNGGGARAGGEVTAVNSRFENNRSTGSQGGGLYARSTVVLTNTHFISNTATSIGGGAFAFGAATVANSRFENNRSTNNAGGGLFAGSTLLLTNTHFLSNTAIAGGGAAADGEVTAVNSRFENNRSTSSDGGGLLARFTLLLTDTLFLRNRAGGNGGGVYVNGTGTATERLVNVLLAGNRAGIAGNAVYAEFSGDNDTLTILHTTIATPTLTSGAAVVMNGRTALIADTIIVNHATGIQRNGGTVTQDYNLFYGNTANTGGTVGGGSHSVVGDPAFVNPAADDYQLTASSAAIDIGANVGVTSDFFGDPRPQGGGFDAGYDESPFTPTGSLVVKKVTVGGNGSFGFSASFTTTRPFTLTTVSNLATHSFANLAPGSGYTLTENTPAGWQLTASSCDNGTPANIIVAPGLTTTCTFTNTKLGSITVKKVTVGGDGSFGFSSSFTTTRPFTLTTVSNLATHSFANLAPGSGYTLTENTPVGWQLTASSCDNGTPANVTVAPGLTTTCTFTNTKLGSITVKKVTVGGDGSFGFSSSFTTTRPFTLTTVSNLATQSFANLGPGSGYTLTENTPAGWQLTASACDNGTPANITVAPGLTTTCTFTNTRLGTIIIEKVTNPPGLTGALFSPQQWVTVNSPVSITASYPAEGALFGPALNATGVTGNLELVNDNTGATTDGCEPLVGFTAGNIAVIDRGLCFFVTKVKNAQDAGAIAVVVVNDVDDETFNMSAPANSPVITIPSLLIGKSSGDTIKAELPGVNATLRAPLGGPFTLDDGQMQTITGLHLGQYTVYEVQDSGFLLDDLVCDDGASSTPSTVDLASAFATINLDPGETVTCTFSNESADLGISKSVTPASAAPGQTITYTLVYSNAGPGDAVGVTISDSLPVSVSLVSVASSGATITQTNGAPNLPWDVEPLSPGEGGVITITAVVSSNNALIGTTIINSAVITGSNEFAPANNSASASLNVIGLPGTIIVQKVVVGTPPTSAWQFVGPTGTFTLPAVGGSAVFTPVAVGPYTISETPQAGYTVSSACSNGVSGAASVNVTLGSAQTITCTFTNTRQVVDIVIVKQSIPQSSTNFRFTGSYLGGGSGSDSGSSIADFYLDDAAPDDGDAYGSSKRFTVPRGAVYSFSEPAVSGWHLASITCDPAGSATVNLAMRSVTIDTSSGYDVACTFRNEKAAALTVRKYRESNGVSGQQAPEAFLSTWTIQVKMPSPTNTLVSQAATNALGKVSFSLKPGSYQVCEVMKSGWTQKVPNPAVNACHALTLLPGSATQVDFGNCPNSSCPVMTAEAGGADTPVEPVTFTVAVDDLDGWVEQWLLTPDGPVEDTIEPDAGEEEDAGLRVFLPVVVK
jgi:uncharacterized repeat protein (TIGR01451 family)